MSRLIFCLSVSSFSTNLQNAANAIEIKDGAEDDGRKGASEDMEQEVIDGVWQRPENREIAFQQASLTMERRIQKEKQNNKRQVNGTSSSSSSKFYSSGPWSVSFLSAPTRSGVYGLFFLTALASEAEAEVAARPVVSFSVSASAASVASPLYLSH